MKNLADVFKEIREAFMRENLNVPEILLDSYDDGMRFSSALQSLVGRLIPVEQAVIDGEQFMGCIVNGLAVRWPLRNSGPLNGTIRRTRVVNHDTKGAIDHGDLAA